MVEDRAVQARELLEKGAYLQAAQAFFAVGEHASAARAFVCCKRFHEAAECYEKAGKTLEAGRLYLQLKKWRKAADIFTVLGDDLRAQIALQKLQEESGLGQAPSGAEDSREGWPEGTLWNLIKAGDHAAASEEYLRSNNTSGWSLLEQTSNRDALKALGETFVFARDYSVAAEAFQRSKEELRAAQCLDKAGLHEEAANLYVRCGQKILAAQQLEKAHGWRSAAEVYKELAKYSDAGRCYERDDEPAKAAAMYLKAGQSDVALPILQAIPPGHRRFAQCRLLAAKILFQKNQGELGVSLLEPLLGKNPANDQGREVLYRAAVLMQQGGKLGRAREAFEVLQRIRFGYRDVTARLEELNGKVDARKPIPSPGGTASPEPSMDLMPLKNCSLFTGMDLNVLRRIWMTGEEKTPGTGETVVDSGEKVGGLYLVLSGGLTITPDPGKSKIAVGFLGTGDYVGLGSLIQGPPQFNALVATAGTRLLYLPADRLADLFTSEPDIGFKVYRTIARQLARTLQAGGRGSVRGDGTR